MNGVREKIGSGWKEAKIDKMSKETNTIDFSYSPFVVILS